MQQGMELGLHVVTLSKLQLLLILEDFVLTAVLLEYAAGFCIAEIWLTLQQHPGLLGCFIIKI